MKTVCIYHSVDLDGWMSAAIVKLAHEKIVKERSEYRQEDMSEFHSINFIGFNYGNSIPDLSDYNQIIMCDISFPKEEMLKLNLRLGENFIWIDHHQRTINDVNSYIIEHGIPMEGSVTEEGENQAACELTWKYFFPNQSMPEIVRLLGRYDCFGHKGTSEETKVLEFQYGARSCISNYDEAYNNLVVSYNSLLGKDTGNVIPYIQTIGEGIYKYLCTEAKQSYQNGFIVEFTEELPTLELVQRKFICVNKERFNAINFGIDYHKDGYDGLAAFHYSGKHWKFSIYNDNGLVDCSVIASQFGGGGHKGASGFILTSLTQIGLK